MSSEQLTRGESATAAEPEPEPTSDWATEADDTRQCRGCGHHVSPDWGRVYGDADGVAWACHNCSTLAALRDGAAAVPDYEGRVDR